MNPRIFSWMRGCSKRWSLERADTGNKGFAGLFSEFEGEMEWHRKSCHSISFIRSVIMPLLDTGMQDKVCLITGANSGIGKATALGLAQMGATVVMVCRDRARGEEAQREIKMKSGNDAVDLLIADLSSQQAIRQLRISFGSATHICMCLSITRERASCSGKSRSMGWR